MDIITHIPITTVHLLASRSALAVVITDMATTDMVTMATAITVMVLTPFTVATAAVMAVVDMAGAAVTAAADIGKPFPNHFYPLAWGP